MLRSGKRSIAVRLQREAQIKVSSRRLCHRCLATQIPELKSRGWCVAVVVRSAQDWRCLLHE